MSYSDTGGDIANSFRVLLCRRCGDGRGVDCITQKVPVCMSVDVCTNHLKRHVGNSNLPYLNYGTGLKPTVFRAVEYLSSSVAPKAPHDTLVNPWRFSWQHLQT
eukprot:3215132-Pyramimonas_sp.AAC.1